MFKSYKWTYVIKGRSQYGRTWAYNVCRMRKNESNASNQVMKYIIVYRIFRLMLYIPYRGLKGKTQHNVILDASQFNPLLATNKISAYLGISISFTDETFVLYKFWS